jgi:hypothetical protein
MSKNAMISISARLYQIAAEAGLANDYGAFHPMKVADVPTGQQVAIRMGEVTCSWCGLRQFDVCVIGTATDAYRSYLGYRQRYFADFEPPFIHSPCNQENERPGAWLRLD